MKIVLNILYNRDQLFKNVQIFLSYVHFLYILCTKISDRKFGNSENFVQKYGSARKQTPSDYDASYASAFGGVFLRSSRIVCRSFSYLLLTGKIQQRNSGLLGLGVVPLGMLPISISFIAMRRV